MEMKKRGEMREKEDEGRNLGGCRPPFEKRSPHIHRLLKAPLRFSQDQTLTQDPRGEKRRGRKIIILQRVLKGEFGFKYCLKTTVPNGFFSLWACNDIARLFILRFYLFRFIQSAFSSIFMPTFYYYS